MSKDKIEVNMNVYDIPILVEALEEANKEIERLQKDLTYYQEYSADLLNKNNTFENIIKEVREYIEKHKHLNWYNDSCYMDDLLEILDKGE